MTDLRRAQLKVALAAVLSVVGLINLVLLGFVVTWIASVAPLPAESLGADETTTVFYDNQNNEVVRLSAKENRLWVSLKEMPLDLQNAFIAVEDERFWTHSGIDPRRILGALWGLVTGGPGAGGGSTITQQLVKNLSGRWEPTLKRKVQEQWSALALEQRLSKEKILELYLNVIYLGNGAYGVQAAARGYFGKDVSALNLAECAFLAGLTKNPARYGTQVPAAVARQQSILNKMEAQKFISAEGHQAALKVPISFNGAEVQKRVGTYSWFVDAAIEDILADLGTAYGWSDSVAQTKLFNGGLKVWLTEDPRVQSSLDEVFTRKTEAGALTFFPWAGHQRAQGAMVVIDPKTGAIVGLTGGSGIKQQSRELNRATQTLRQPGSVIKPLGVYAPALERDLITEATVVEDSPLHLAGAEEGLTWDPSNFEGTFGGLTTIRSAVAHSNNIVAIKTLLQVGMDESMDFLKSLGITTLVPEDRQAALALGGLTKGVTVREVAGAYATIASGGLYRAPYTYLRVEDHGQVLLEHKDNPVRVMTEQTASLMTDLMTEVLRSGTAKGYAVAGGKVATAGKTGTTQDVKDKWFAGFTPSLVGVTWYGYDRPRSFPAEQQPIRVWSAVMEAAHQNLKVTSARFAVPSGIVKAEACVDSGQRPTAWCSLDPRAEAGQPRVATFAFKAGTEPTDDCTVHGAPVTVLVDGVPVQRSFLHKPTPWQEPLAGDPPTLDSIYEEKNALTAVMN
jgi:penicillin-binding protein 1A